VSRTQEKKSVKKPERKKSLIDEVESIVFELWDDPEFSKYLEAVYDYDAVEGSTAIDDVMAAIRVREQACDEGTTLDVTSLAVVVKTLNHVLRRYNLSRKQRRDSAKFNMPNKSDNVLGITDESDDEHD
jgi:hypothetical protein